ncbi:hypothetical protein HKX48_003611 [Thoreauomyces humboldtii]|nr:hypothetical protein HKX48_003611 [Thoreauomyces humboldtii]
MNRPSQGGPSSTTELERKLKHLLRNSEGGPLAPQVQLVREDLRDELERAVLLGYQKNQTNDAESNLWKLAHYKVIEEFRTTLKETNAKARRSGRSDEKKALTVNFRSFLSDASSFYIKFICKLQRQFQLRGSGIDAVVKELNLVMDVEVPADVRYKIPADVASRAIGSCYRSLIYLGDLARYREIYADRKETNWGTARMFYNLAIRLMPENGNPYNQLAVIASYAGDELAAVEYYFRSLVIARPFLTAAENVQILFDKVQKRYESSSASAGHVARDLMDKKDLQDRFIVMISKVVGRRTSLDEFFEIMTNWSSGFRRTMGICTWSPAEVTRLFIISTAVVHALKDQSLTFTSSTSSQTPTTSLEMRCQMTALVTSMIRDVFEFADGHAQSGVVPKQFPREWLSVILIMAAWLKSQELEDRALLAGQTHLWEKLAILLTRLSRSVGDSPYDIPRFSSTPEETQLQGFLPLRSYFADLPTSSDEPKARTDEQRHWTRDMASHVRIIRILRIGVFFANLQELHLACLGEGENTILAFETQAPVGGARVSGTQALAALDHNSTHISFRGPTSLATAAQEVHVPRDGAAPMLKRSVSGSQSEQWVPGQANPSSSHVDEDAFGHKIMLPMAGPGDFTFSSRGSAAIPVPYQAPKSSFANRSPEGSKMFGTSSDAVDTMAFLGLGSLSSDGSLETSKPGTGMDDGPLHNPMYASNRIGQDESGYNRSRSQDPSSSMLPPPSLEHAAHRPLSTAYSPRVHSAPDTNMTTPWLGEYSFPFAAASSAFPDPGRRASMAAWTDSAHLSLHDNGRPGLSWIDAFAPPTAGAPGAAQWEATQTKAFPEAPFYTRDQSPGKANPSQYPGMGNANDARNVWG